jgi:phenylalanine-4-hydroxylase
MLVTVPDTAADQEPAAAEDTAAVDDLIRTLVRMGLDQQTYFVTEAVERLEQAISNQQSNRVRPATWKRKHAMS